MVTAGSTVAAHIQMSKRKHQQGTIRHFHKYLRDGVYPRRSRQSRTPTRSFRDLPRELRDEIYHYTLHHKRKTINLEATTHGLYPRDDAQEVLGRLRRLCDLFLGVDEDEAKFYFYSNHVFEMTLPLPDQNEPCVRGRLKVEVQRPQHLYIHGWPNIERQDPPSPGPVGFPKSILLDLPGTPTALSPLK